MRRQPTSAERALWRALRTKQFKGLKWRRQVPIGPFVVDFYCPAVRLVVEVDGDTHGDPRVDATRTAWLGRQGLRVVRFWNSAVAESLDGVLLQLAEVCGVLTPPPGPLPQGAGEKRALRSRSSSSVRSADRA